MPPLTVSRLQEVMSAAENFEARLRGLRDPSAAPLAQVYERFADAVTDVNAALGEVRELLLEGLRDEALSMHDAELITVARRLGIQDRADWVSVHSWLLEQGMPVPDEIDISGADQFEAAAHDVDSLAHDLDTLRRLVLERAPLVDRLAVLRGLQSRDLENPVWATSVADHERAVIEDFQRCLPTMRRNRDIDALAEMESTLADLSWGVSPPPLLLGAVEGAGQVAGLRALAAQAKAVAAEMNSRPVDGTAPVTAVNELIALKDRLEGLAHDASGHVTELASHPAMLAIARAEGVDTACERLLQEDLAPLIERIRGLETLRDTRQVFHDGCRRLEFLCDHPPERGDASRWLADVQRTDSVVRRCCQELADLLMPPLLQERVLRAAAAVESRDSLNRRFTVMVAAAGVVLLLGATAFGGWWLWKRSEWRQLLSELRSEVAAAQAGYRLQRSPFVQRMSGLYGGDPLVVSLVEEFDSGITGERDRTRRFEELMAAVAEQDGSARADVGRITARVESLAIEAWPGSLVEGVERLAEARAIGGLPERRGGNSIQPPPEARERFQREEDRLAAFERSLATHDRRLEQAAVKVFEQRLDDLRGQLVGAPPAVDVRRIREEVAQLRDEATAPRGVPRGELRGVVVEGSHGPAGGGVLVSQPRVPEDVTAALDAVDERVRTLLRER